MTKTSESEAGFTLIELMIVIAIIGILAMIAIPNFLRARNSSMYTSCLESLSSLKVAEEMYVTDNQIYVPTGQMDLLAMYLVPGCVAEDGSDCTGKVQERICGNATCVTSPSGGSCIGANVISVNSGYDYEIVGTSKDRSQCRICVKAQGYLPAKYAACTTSITCP
jgi:prepilin-type N-terminal cleavage/methylation domain-containing protein